MRSEQGEEHSKYTILWKSRVGFPDHVKNHTGTKTGGVLVVIEVIGRTEKTADAYIIIELLNI